MVGWIKVVVVGVLLVPAIATGNAIARDDTSSELVAPRGATKEIVSARTANSSTWQMPSGEHITRIAPAPIHWRDATGAWRDYDLSLTRDPSQQDAYTADVGPTRLSVPGNLRQRGEEAPVTITGPGGTIEWTLRGSGDAEASLDGGVALYRGAIPGVDMRVRGVVGGMKEDLLLNGPESPSTFEYELATKAGLTPELKLGGRAIALHDPQGRSRYLVPAAPVVDAKHRPGPMPTYSLRPEGESRWAVTMTVDREWLGDSSRAWPVTVDPTTSSTTDLGTAWWCWGALASPSTTRLFAGEYFCPTTVDGMVGNEPPFGGESSWHHRVGLRFDLASALGTNEVVSQATLHLTSWSSGGADINVARLDYDTPAAAVSPFNAIESTFSRTPPSNWLASASPPIPGSTTSGPVSADVTHFTAQWQARRSSTTAGRPNYGLMLWSDERDWGTNGAGETNPPCPTGAPTYGSCWSLTYFYGPGASDPAQRPYLEVVTWPSAPTANRVTAPIEGRVTGRRVELRADVSAASATGVQFQYVMGDERAWAPIPASALTYAHEQPGGGTAVPASGEVAVTNERTEPVVWDLQATSGGQLDGNVHVRALVVDPGGVASGVTKEVNFVLDRTNSEKVATAPIGPGEVNLVTGDFLQSATDATVKAATTTLALKRTYHSRGTPVLESGPFGPGWSAGVDGSGTASAYKSLTANSEISEQYVTNWVGHETLNQVAIPTDVGCICINIWGWEYYPVTETLRWEYQYATVALADGGTISFSQTVDPSGQPSGWKADDSHSALKLSKSAGVWTVTDEKGNATSFAASADGSATYVPSSFTQAGATAPTQYTYDVVDGAKRLTKITAPVMSGVANPEREARYLRFVWENVTTSAGLVPRVTSARFGRWDPTQSAVAEIAVATYTYDNAGRLASVSDPRVAGGLTETYAYDAAGHLTQYTPAGEAAWRMAYTEASGDDNDGRLASVTRAHPTLGDATWSVRYDVPLSGANAPAQMTASAMGTWGQVDDLPTDATAIFPPKHVPVANPTSFSYATVHYLDAKAKEVNVLQPGGAIATKQYDANGNVVLELTASNREAALSSASPAATAASLSTIHRYASNGVDETEALGPRHEVTLKDGSVVQARTQVLTNHDYGSAPNPNLDYHLPTAKIVAAKLDDGTRRDISTTTFGYDNPDGTHRGWELRKPTKTVTDAGSGNLNITEWTIYDANAPVVRATRTAKSTGAGNHETQYFYYGLDATQPGCSGSGLAGLLCKKQTPVSSGTAALPVDTYTYDTDWNKTQHVQTVGSTTRTTTTTYDGDGRQASITVGTSPATDTVSVSNTYGSTTGNLVQTTTPAAGSEPARSVTRTYDSNGRLSSYQDADGETTTYTYDLNGNLATQADSKSTITLSYNDRDLATGLADSATSVSMSATYDANGDLATQSLPGQLTKRVTRNAAGDIVDQFYEKGGCSSSCNWAQSTVDRDPGGRVAREVSGGRTRVYEYDGAGRIRVAQVTTGGQCTTRVYAYDANSNRTSRRTYPPATNGDCSQSTTYSSQTLAYDEADRINSTGFATDALGRQTDAPAGAVGSALTATFYANDRAHTLAQDGVTKSYRYDPDSRIRWRSTSGGDVETVHYTDEGDAPSWTAIGSSTWTRDLDGLDGQTIATRETDGTIRYLLTDTHGDVVAKATASATTPTATTRYDEFGAPVSGVAPRTGWLGAADRSTELASGVIAMGARTYVPQLGRFLQPEPLSGSGPNAYDYALQDPINGIDLAGTCPFCVIAIPIGIEIAIDVGIIVTAGVVTAVTVHDIIQNMTYRIDVDNGIDWGDPFTFMAKGGKSSGKGNDPLYDKTAAELKELKGDLGNSKQDKAMKRKIDKVLKELGEKNKQKRQGRHDSN